MTKEYKQCPKCKSDNISQDRVDVGVGTIYRPAQCNDCGWSQEAEEDDIMRKFKEEKKGKLGFFEPQAPESKHIL